MKANNKINQHTQLILEERGLSKSLYDLFQNHKTLSFLFWSVISFITLLPFSVQNAFSSKFIVLNLLGNKVEPSIFLDSYIVCFTICSFFAPIFFSTLFLTSVLPLSKLSKNKYFKKYLGKYFTKFPILVSSCDTIHYQEEFLLQFSNDIDLNLSMSSYYKYLLQFPFESEIKKTISFKINNLLNIDIKPEEYLKDFPSIVLSFIHDFEHFSKSHLLIKENYNQKLDKYFTNIFLDNSTVNNQDTTLHETLEEDISKKKFKEML